LIAERVPPNLHYGPSHQDLLSHRLPVYVGISDCPQHNARTCQFNDGVFFGDVAVFE
jgi:hypothetical protein